MPVEPSFNRLYLNDDGRRVLCGGCLDDEYEEWPEDWSEVYVGVEWQYACDACGRSNSLSEPRG